MGPDYSLGAIPVRILLLNRVYVVLVVGLLSVLGLSWLASVDGGTIFTWAAPERLLPIYSVDTEKRWLCHLMRPGERSIRHCC